MFGFSRGLPWVAYRTAAFAAILLFASCAAITPRNALPEATAALVEPEGFHNIR
jgi:hypothetical protein